MPGVISPSVKNVTGNENEGNPGRDGSNANEEQREGTAEHKLGFTQVFGNHNRIEV